MEARVEVDSAPGPKSKSSGLAGNRSIPLPVEILREVLMLARDASLYWESAFCSDWWGEICEPSAIGRLPLDVAAVCRTWRHVALQTPHLWTRILVKACSEGTELEMSPNSVKLMLARSGSLPLDIFVDLHDARQEDCQERWDDIFAQILGVSTRWRVLSLHQPLPVPPSALDTLCEVTAPLLEHLHLDAYRLLRFSKPDSEEVPELLLNYPSLRCLRLRNYFVSLCPARSTYHSLTRICFDSESNIDLNEFWELLSASPALECLELADLTLRDDPWAPALYRLCLPNLAKLKLDNYYQPSYVMRHCAEFLDLPRLEHIDCAFYDTEEFHALAPRVWHSLQRLAIGMGAEGFEKALLPDLAALTRVRTFELEQEDPMPEHDVPPVLFQMMKDGSLFPRLEVLSFSTLFLVWGVEAEAEAAKAYWVQWRRQGSPSEETEAAALALLDFVASRNSACPAGRDLSREMCPRLKLIRFTDCALESEFLKRVEALVQTEVRIPN